MVAASFPLDLKEHHLAWPTFSAGQSRNRMKRGRTAVTGFFDTFGLLWVSVNNLSVSIETNQKQIIRTKRSVVTLCANVLEC